MRVVIVTEGCCYPANSGARLRTLHLMLPLARKHQLTYVCRASGTAEEKKRAKAFFAEQGIQAILVEDPAPTQSGAAFYTSLAGNLFSTLPYSIRLHNSQHVSETLRSLAQAKDVDLWQLEWLPYVEAVQDLPGKKVYIAHDVTAQIWQRHSEMANGLLKRWFVRGQQRKMQRYEGRIVRSVDRVVAVSDEDRALLYRLYGIDNVDVVENGVDPDYYAEVPRTAEEPRILYVGALESRPNQDAVRQLFEVVFPVVKRSIPEAKLCLVGRNPPTWMQERAAQTDGVELHANVPDVRPYFSKSSVLAVSLRIAGGSRIKILEALAARLPVVSTQVGAEGLHLTPNENLEIAPDVEAMGEMLVRSLREPERMQQLADRGRLVVRQRYDWGALADKLSDTWQTCRRGEAPKKTEKQKVTT